MARETYRMLQGQLVSLGEWYTAQPRKHRSHLPAPAIRTDGMSATLNHADGRLYDSRSAYERALHETGHHIVEAGEMTGGPKTMDAPTDIPVEQSIKEAVQQLEGRT